MIKRRVYSPTQSRAQQRQGRLKAKATKLKADAEKSAPFRVKDFKVTAAQPPIPHQAYNVQEPILFGRIATKPKMNKGVPVQTITITTANRLHRALQVRNARDRAWGSVKVTEFNRGADETRFDQELNRWKMNWINNGFFGGDAEWRITTVVAPGRTSTH